MISSAPSIFESFNARALKLSDVAKTFVPSRHYRQLIKRCHTIIVGPRGSGKTTLLKMLQQPALEAWEHPQADDYRSHIDYTGVFIATDISWGAQIEALGEGKIDEASHTLLSNAAFTTHVLRSLVTAMLHRVAKSVDGNHVHTFRRVQLSNNQEASLVHLLIDAWDIKPAIPSLLSLKQSLGIRLLKIREIASKELILGEEGRPERLATITFLLKPFVNALEIATDYFNDLVGEPDGKWALLFDELEIAPQRIQDELLRSLRSTDPKFIYKLAMSPFSLSARLMGMETGLSPAPDQDFEQIALWYAEKHHAYKFCQDLWESMLEERGIEQKDPRKVLGSSYFETSYEEWSITGTAYSPNSKISQRFVSLAEKDVTFRNYLSEKSIDPNQLNRLPKAQMNSVVRKISPLIAVREYYRAPDRDGIRRIERRTRKSAILYAGAESLFAISEGNPRWFIAIVGRLLDRWQIHSIKIQRGAQATEMLQAAHRFSAMLRTIPVPLSEAKRSKKGLHSLVGKVANFFHDQVVVEDFIAEPPATFTVDSHTEDDVLLMLAQALNAGAIVYVPEGSNQLMLSTLRGKRFRISYLLAPLYGLPLRLGVHTSLSKILSTSSNEDMGVSELPFEGEDGE